MIVDIGEINPFPNAKCDEEQAAKILEDAAEVFCAWQLYDKSVCRAKRTTYGPALKCIASFIDAERDDLLSECADLIMACSNMRAWCVKQYQNPYMKNRALLSVDPIPCEKHYVRGILRAASLVDSATDSYVCARREYGAESEQTYHAIDRLLTQLFECIFVTCCIIAALGVNDFTSYMKECEKRNRDRGRYDDSRADNQEQAR